MADLGMYRGTPWLLPNLVALRWTNFDVSCTQSIPLFLGPNLTTLCLAFQHDAIAWNSELSNHVYGEVVNLVESLLDICPSLTEIEIGDWREEALLMATLPFLYRCQRMQGFFVTNVEPGWSRDDIRRLASQHSLKKVFLSFSEDIAADLSFLTTDISLQYPFPSLDSIYLATPTLPSFTELIKAMGRCRLRIITIEFWTPSNADQLYDLFVTLWHKCSKTSLQRLYIATRIPDYAMGPGNHTLTLNLLLPMFDFPNITCFSISMPLVGCLLDREFAHIALRWPWLTDLGFCDSWGWTKLSEVTFAAIAFVAWKCPQLVSLAAAVNPNIDNVALVTRRRGFKPNRALRFFNALDSPMGDPLMFARVLHSFAPNIVRVSGLSRNLDEQDSEEPLDQDPIAFFESVTNILFDLREGKEPGRSRQMLSSGWGESLSSFRPETVAD